MRVLLLGGNGFIGRHVASGLRLNGHEIQMLDYPDIDLSVTLDEFTNWIVKRSFSPVDLLINCIGVNGAQESFSQSRHFFQLNGFSAIHLAKLITHLDCKKFIHISSETVLGSGEGIDEKTSMTPAHPYAFSKAIFEAYMMTDPVFDKITSIALRFPIIAGSENSIQSALDFIKEDFAEKRPVVLFGDGSHRRKFLSVEDTPRVIELCAAVSKTGFQVLHSPGVVLSMNEIYENLCKIHGSNPEIVFREPKTASQISTIISTTSEIFTDFDLSSIF